MTTGPTAARRLCVVAGAVVVVLCLMLAVAGAASAGSPSTAAPEASAPPGATVYRLGTMEYVDNLNPFIGYSGIDYTVYDLAYDFLVSYDPVKLQPRPAFAQSWSHSSDGKTWTFKTRPGMTWSDGQPATAHDAAFTFNYIMKNDLSFMTGYLTYVKKVTALDDTTVQIVCSKPKADILQMKVPILPEHIWSKVSGDAAATSFTNQACVGSGPYRVVKNVHNSYCLLEPNKSYWGAKPHIDQLVIVSYTDANSMVEDFESGQLDGVVNVPPGQFKRLGSKSITTNPCVSWSFEQLTFNCYPGAKSTGNPVMRDPKFRQALQYAVDRQTNARIAYNAYLSVGGTLLPPYSVYAWQPPSDQAYTYDPAKAKALLAAAGYEDVNGDGSIEDRNGKPLTLRLYTDAQTRPNITTSKLVVAWLKNVGVRVHLQVLDPGALSADEANSQGNTFAPDFDMVVWWWEGDAESPQFILSLLTPGQVGGWSDTSWTDPRYTKLFNQESTTIDPQKRIALIQQMQQIAYQASPYVIFGYPEFLEAYNSAKWAGYVKEPSGFPGYNGDVFYYDSFLQLHHVTGATSGGRGTTWIYPVAVVVIAAVVVGIVVVRRRASEPETEPED